MPSGSSYNYFSSSSYYGRSGHQPISITPFNELDLQDEKEILSWMGRTTRELFDYHSAYRRLHRENLGMYVGDAPGSYNLEMWNGSSFSYLPNTGRKDLNVVHPIVETHLSRITSSRANVSVLPVHSNEFNDLSAAKNAESALRQSFDQRSFNDKLEQVARTMLICGYGYMLVNWDEMAGPPLLEAAVDIPVMDEEGNPKLDDDGEPLVLPGNIRMGDVNYKPLRPDQVLECPGIWGETVDWVVVMELHDIYRLRQQYPSVAHKIECDKINPAFEEDFLLAEMRGTEHQVVVYTLYHRSTPEFPEGWQITTTATVVLESVPLPYPSLNKYGLLPVERVHDTQVPGYALPLPMSVMEAGKAYAETFNRVDRLIRKDMSLSVPKWVVHLLSGTNKSQLSTLSNYVNYKGTPDMKPELIRPSATSSEFFAYRDRLLQELQVNTGSANMLNKPPPNTRAATMLQHLEEQEFARAEPLIRHMNDFISRIGRISIAIMADKYTEDPLDSLRLIKLSGGKGPSSFIRLQTADLVGPFDVRYERTSALPESKQGRLNEAARLFEMGLIDEQQYKTIIGFDTDPDLQTAESKAYESQLLENDLMLRGQQVEAPLEYQDHVEHLRAMYPIIESIEYAEAPPEIKELFVLHAMAHEMFAWQRAQVSLRYAMKVEKHVKWMFFSALPAAIPVGVDNPVSPAAQEIATTRMTTPGLVAPEKAGPDNPESV